MAYYLVSDFRSGVDRRRHPIAAPAGSLRELYNCAVTPGGEVEKRRGFFPVEEAMHGSVGAFSALMDNVIGLVGADDELFVFVSHTDATVPHDLTYPAMYGDVAVKVRELDGCAGTPLSIVSHTLWRGVPYIVVETDQTDRNRFQHFFPEGGDPSRQLWKRVSSRITDKDGNTHTYYPDARAVLTFKTQIIGVIDQEIRYTNPDEDDPTAWGKWNEDKDTFLPNFVNCAQYLPHATTLLALEPYYDSLAVFSRRSILFWQIDPDPTKWVLRQTMSQTGTLAPMSACQFGAGDVMFLSGTGVRSLTAKNSSNAAAVNDVGSPIDEEIRSVIADNGLSYVSRAQAIVEEDTGRFWLAFGHTIWVLSVYPGPKVTAWSEYEPSVVIANAEHTFETHGITQAGGQPFLWGTVKGSGANVILAFGGPGGFKYDTCEATVQTPYLQFEHPGLWKHLQGIDAAVTGEWTIEAAYDPNRHGTGVYETIAVLTPTGTEAENPERDASTYNHGIVPGHAVTTSVSTRFRSRSPMRARLANFAWQYERARID